MTYVRVTEKGNGLVDKHTRTRYRSGDVFETTSGLAARYVRHGLATIAANWVSVGDDRIRETHQVLENTAEEEDTMENKALDVKYEAPKTHANIRDHLENMTVAELRDKAFLFGIGEDDLEGTGVNGNILKNDWVNAILEKNLG